MDSLATDIKKIFGEDGAMGCQEIYAGKSIAYKALKRLFDMAASSVALIVLSPVFLAAALAIYLEDGGPVFLSSPGQARI